MRDLIPILKTFKKQKMAPALLAFQIAVTFMVLVNAIYMIAQRSELIARPIGANMESTLTIITNLPTQQGDLTAQLEHDLTILKGIHGVINAAPITGLPLEGWGMYTDFKLEPNGEDVAYGGYFGSNDQLIDTFGLTLVAGENFLPSDIQKVENDGVFKSSKLLITQALAKKLYPDDWLEVLGKNLYYHNEPHEVVGIVDTLQNAWNFWSAIEYTVISAVQEANDTQRYVLRVDPAQIENVIAVIPERLLTHPQKQIESIELLTDVKMRSYREDLATNKLLTAVCISLTIITVFGILGQAKFSISRRTKQIGTRRALGASKHQVISYFMLENAIISIIGVCVGFLAAIILNNQFVELLSLTPVPINFLLFGAIAIVLLGQIAVAYPVSQAAKISPAITTRGA
ncbi:FtsX-like permease family protein [Pseudoalteromonas sp. MMG005]|uniref:ABC transporter permease n=1 Tax=Pseudoalteromonas sp. MMG005 TaxID=2822682 RepID=UPI001B39F794|nr:FtsX-like permease family protein [Pseudoalteromonas sp. MMG005]MBQ4846724.1 FtsX-like permease family protein [Pseudoalteromonas sp. MMG005]